MPKISSPQPQKQCTHLIMTNSLFPATLANSPRSTHFFVVQQLLNLSCKLSKRNVPLNPVTTVELTVYQAILDCSICLSILCWAASSTKAVETRTLLTGVLMHEKGWSVKHLEGRCTKMWKQQYESGRRREPQDWESEGVEK